MKFCFESGCFNEMKNSCAYSFADLYRAAFGKSPQPKTMLDLFAKSREEINLQVAEWAKIAGWKTQIRTGAAGVEYLAFCPRDSSK